MVQGLSPGANPAACPSLPPSGMGQGTSGQEARILGTEGVWIIVEFRNLNGEAPPRGRIQKINCSAGLYWNMDYPDKSQGE